MHIWVPHSRPLPMNPISVVRCALPTSYHRELLGLSRRYTPIIISFLFCFYYTHLPCQNQRCVYPSPNRQCISLKCGWEMRNEKWEMRNLPWKMCVSLPFLWALIKVYLLDSKLNSSSQVNIGHVRQLKLWLQFLAMRAVINCIGSC